MKWERKQNQGKFILRISKGRGWFMEAGSTYENGKEGKPCARTTSYISEAKGFKTAKSAEAMKRILSERYGLETQVVMWER